MHLHEKPVRFSRSKIWDIQRAYYDSRGEEAWSSGEVPSETSAHAYLARAYARVIAGFARDRWTEAGSRRGPRPTVTVLELGAGSGRFAFLTAKALGEIAEREAALDFRYVLTDIAPDNLKAWGECGAFDRFLERGQLAFGLFDVDAPGPVTDAHGKPLITSRRPADPLVVVGNYVADSLRHDIFRSADDKIQEARYAVATENQDDLGAADAITRLQLQRSFHAAPAGYYKDEALDKVLEDYRRQLDDHMFLIPIGTVRAIEALEKLTRGPLLALFGDKGYRRLSELDRYNRLSIVPHGGAFSISVNFEALGRYAAHRDGAAWFSNDWERRFVVSGLLLGGDETKHPLARRAFYRNMEAFSPRDVSALTRSLRRLGSRLPLTTMLYLIKLANWDGATFARFSTRMRTAAVKAGEDTRAALRETLDRVADNHYPLGMTRDVPYRLGLIYETLGDHEEAIRCFERSSAEGGRAHLNHYRIARVHEKRGDAEAALAQAKLALEAKPEHRPTRSLVRRLEKGQ